MNFVAQDGHPRSVSVAPDGPNHAQALPSLRTHEMPRTTQRPNLYAQTDSRGNAGRGVCAHHLVTMHGRSRMVIDPCIPILPGRRSVGFSPTRQTLLEPSPKRNVRCPASCMRGGQHPTKKTLLRLFCIWMTASINSLILWCGHSQRQQWGYSVTALWVSYHIHTTPYDHPPCVE